MRLVDADAIEKQAYDDVHHHAELEDWEFDVVVNYLARAETIDAAPVVHGRWVGLEYDGYADGCPVYDVWECSECGEEVSGEDVPETHPYCHGCGARMDGGAADGV